MGEKFMPRGIGNNWLECFVCGTNSDHSKVQPDMASFVPDRTTGEKVVNMFQDVGLHAHLDYRPSEPKWIQVKLGACQQHLPNLQTLEKLAIGAGREISSEIIAQAIGKAGK